MSPVCRRSAIRIRSATWREPGRRDIDLRIDTQRIARATPATLLHPERLLCQLMQLGTYDDVRTARALLGDDAFRDALRVAPPGVLDDKSWNFWHRVLGSRRLLRHRGRCRPDLRIAGDPETSGLATGPEAPEAVLSV